MTEQGMKSEGGDLTLLEDGEKCFVLDGDGRYMNPDRMKELALKLFKTAAGYGPAIERFNRKKEGE